MEQRHLVSSDGSLVTVESLCRYRCRGSGRILPRSRRKKSTPRAIYRSQVKAAVARKETHRLQQAQRKNRRLAILVVSIVVISYALAYFLDAPVLAFFGLMLLQPILAPKKKKKPIDIAVTGEIIEGRWRGRAVIENGTLQRARLNMELCVLRPNGEYTAVGTWESGLRIGSASVEGEQPVDSMQHYVIRTTIISYVQQKVAETETRYWSERGKPIVP